MTYEDVRYEVDGPNAVITIDREKRMNAFRGKTIEELIHAFKRAWADPSVNAVIFTGAGDRAFCVGGDVKQRAETGNYGPTENGLFEVGYLQRLIREIPKPVIAAVNGAAIGGGHVLHVLCDLSIAAEHATFGQAGPRVGSFDAGFGSAYLARVVGEKRAREIWFLLDQYDAATAERWGLVNKVVPMEDLLNTAYEYARRIAANAPLAVQASKELAVRSRDMDLTTGLRMEKIVGRMLQFTEDAKEGPAAFAARRKPDFKGK
jgi:naphthoate synthase